MFVYIYIYIYILKCNLRMEKNTNKGNRENSSKRQHILTIAQH